MRQRSGNVSALSMILLALILELLSPSTCAREVNGGAFSRPPQSASDEYKAAREQMVREQIEARGIRDARVLAALRKVPRHLFVPPRNRAKPTTITRWRLGMRKPSRSPMSSLI